MVRPRGGVDAADIRRSLLLTTAIVTLITVMAGPRSASAQVVITGNNDIGTLAAPGWSTGDPVSIGDAGVGAMNIAGGSTVSNADGYIGAQGTGVGTVTVTGQGSVWTNGGQTVIGDLGTGTLSILNGGVVNTGAIAVLGNQSDLSGTGVGTVTVSGHDASGNVSTWNIAAQILVGGADDVNSRGTLNILNGGVVNSGQGLIAWGIGSQGDVTVSGRDTNGHASTWKADNNIYVGFNGNGTLKVLDGAAVTTSAAGGGAASIYIGDQAGGTGAVTVASTRAMSQHWPQVIASMLAMRVAVR